LNSAKSIAEDPHGVVATSDSAACAEQIGACSVCAAMMGTDQPLAPHRLGDGITAMAREDEEREIASKSVWFKRKSPSYLLGQRRKRLAALPRCLACQGLALGRDRAIGQLLDLMGEPRHRRALKRGYGLCLKHFADAYVVAPKGVVRDALTAIQIKKLAVVRPALAPLLKTDVCHPASARNDCRGLAAVGLPVLPDSLIRMPDRTPGWAGHPVNGAKSRAFNP
jgi:hypothetical protein